MGNPTNTNEQGKHITLDVAKAIDKKLEELGELKSKLIGIGMGARPCTRGVWNDL